MAYIIGIVSTEEAEELRRRGWELEDPPEELKPFEAKDDDSMQMVWVDSSMFEIMSGPDWDKAGDEPDGKLHIRGQLGQ